MKIAFLAPRFHTNQITLVSYLIKNGNQISFYVTRKGQIEDHSILKPKIIQKSIFTSLVKSLIRPKNFLFDYKYGMPSFKEIINFKSQKFDLIIIRDPINLMGLIYFVWAKIIGMNILLYAQQEIYKNKSSIKEKFKEIFIKLTKNKWISPCLGKKKFKKISKNIYYLPFCYYPHSYKKKWFINNRFNILTIGKFIERKNHLLLIKAIRRLNLKLRHKISLIIIGECVTEDNYQYLQKVKKAAKKSSLKIKILTNINPKKIKKYYKISDCFVLPSANEPASVSNIEAMAYGLPVITTDTNQTSCYTKNGINGYIVKSNNSIDLSNKIKLLILNSSKTKKFGRESLKLIKKKYNPEIIYKKFFTKLLWIN